MSEILIGAVVLAGAAIWGWFFGRRGHRAREQRRRVQNLKTKQEALKDAETQDDRALIDRLTRRP